MITTEIDNQRLSNFHHIIKHVRSEQNIDMTYEKRFET